VGITVWEGRVAPLLDTAQRLWAVDVDGGREVGRREVALTEVWLPHRARRLADEGIGVLLCGAVSRRLAGALAALGVQVVPWLAGDAEQVLQAYLRGELNRPRWCMPGWRRWRRGRRRGAWKGG